MNLTRWIGITVLYLGMAGCLEAQTETPEAIFSNAYVLEADSSADAATKALAQYERVLATSPDGAIGVRARVAAARCLRKLGRLDAARTMLAEAKKIGTTDEPAQKELDAESKELEKASAAKVDAGPTDEFEKKILILCATGRTQDIAGLGRSALPALLKIIDNKITAGGHIANVTNAANAHANAVKTVIVGGYQEGVESILKQLADKSSTIDRTSVVTTLCEAFLGNGRNNEIFNRFARSQTTLLRALLADSDPLVRSRAASIMHEVVGMTFDDFERALKDEILDVRKNALACATSNYNRIPAKDRDALLRIAVKDSAAVIRAEVADEITGLRREGQVKLAEELIDILMRDKDAFVRVRTVQRTANPTDPQTRALARLAMADEDPQVRAAGVYALNATNQDIPALRRLLADKDMSLVQRVQQILANFPSEQVLDSPEAEREIVAALKSSSEQARQFAYALLAKSGSVNVAADVTAALSAGTEGEHRCAIYYVIRHNMIDQFPRILTILPGIQGSGVPYGNQVSMQTRQVPNWNDATGNAVTEWLRVGKRSKELMALLAAFDKVPQTQGNFVFERLLNATLGVVSANELPELLDVIMKIEDLNRRSAALEVASSKFETDAAAMAAYEAALSSSSGRLRATAARHMAKYGAPEASATLIRALIGEKDPEIATQIGKALASRAALADLGALEKAYLETTDSSVRYTILSTMEKMESAEVNAALMRLLAATEVPANVFAVLGRRKVAEAAPVIRAWLASDAAAKHENSRDDAINALGLLKDVEAVDLLVSMLSKFPEDSAWGDRFKLEVDPGKEHTSHIRFHPAYLALYEINQSRLVDAVRQTIIPGKFDESIKRQGILMMTWVADASASRLIIETIESGSPSLQSSAARAAGEALLGSAASALRNLVRSPSPAIRAEAERALQRLVSLGVPMS